MVHAPERPEPGAPPVRINLYSDTQTLPTPAMKEAMMRAPLGDEQHGDDPTVHALCDRMAALLGKEAAVFLPSGTMCNIVATLTHCRPGDEILWYLIEDYNDPVPDELGLAAPATAKRGEPFEVKVTRWADDGDRSPAAGVDVSGADAPTGADGRTTVTIDGRTAALRATTAGAIASNEEVVCTTALRNCPAGYAKTIGGTTRGDEIEAGRGSERILAGAGKDEIDARRGAAPDRINCGPGKDRLIVPRKSQSKYRGCERVRFRR